MCVRVRVCVCVRAVMVGIHLYVVNCAGKCQLSISHTYPYGLDFSLDMAQPPVGC